MKLQIETSIDIGTHYYSTTTEILRGPVRDTVEHIMFEMAPSPFHVDRVPIADRAITDNPELCKELGEAVKEIREFQKAIKARMTPLMRKAEKALAQADRDLTKEVG